MRIPRTARLALPVVVLVAYLLAMFVPYPVDEAHYDAMIRETGVWRDPSAAGADLRFDASPDGSRLLLVGYGAPGEVRVTDRRLSSPVVLAPPGTPFTVKGAAWSDLGAFIVVWGRVAGEGADELAVYNATTLAAVPDLVPRGSVPLDTIDAACLAGYDRILALAGSSDANGTERVLFCEVGPFLLLRDAPSPGEGGVVSVRYDGAELACVDQTGHVMVYRTSNWTYVRGYHDPPGAPTVVSISQLLGNWWAFGGSAGNVTVLWGSPMRLWFDQSVGTGPVQAVTGVKGDPTIALVGVPATGGGSRLQLWSLQHGFGNVPRVMREAATDAAVTMLGPDPSAADGVVAGFSDGTLRTYRVSVAYHEAVPNRFGQARDALGDAFPFALVAVVAWLGWEAWRWRRGSGR